MKLFKKTISAFVLACVVAAMCAVPAFAAGSQVEIKANQQGFELTPGSGYTATDLFGNFKNMMPGDTREEIITIKSNATKSNCAEVYLRVVPHVEGTNDLSYDEAFENADGKDQANVDGVRDEDIASTNDFLAQLEMEIYAEDQLVYSGSAAGLAPLDSNTLLCSLVPGEEKQLRVVVKAPLTMGNEYANRVGEVDWMFTLEEKVEPEVLPESQENPQDEGKSKGGTLIQTGQLKWPIAVCGLAGLALLAAGVVLLKKKRTDEQA